MTTLAHAAAAPRLNSEQALELASYLSALARAELPLGPGLLAVASDLPAGRLASALRLLAARLEAGESLESALASLGAGLPQHMRAVMSAGARSGQLADTLDDLLTHERDMDDMGRRLWQTVSYPLLLISFLFVWLLFVSWWLIPHMEYASLAEDIDALNWSGRPSPREPSYTQRMEEFARVTPALLLSLVGTTALVSCVAGLVGGRALLSRWLAYVPLVGPAWWNRSLVELSGLLAVFLKHELPLPESLRLTSSAGRDAAVRATAARAATETSAGRALAQSLAGDALFPPTMVKLVQWGEEHHALGSALERASQMYRERFELQLRLIRVVLPPLVFLLVAGSALLVAAGWLGSIAMAIRLLTGMV
ncbi:MAG: type II secretion system F family protein [Pirellulales bacterium]